jgi:cytochrome bd-type quinol oxidase subunit 2
MLFLILIVPGLVVLYALILRPVLRKVPALATFYAESDGFWQTVWAYCGKSLTLAWGYILGGVGSAVALLDPLSSALGDPEFKGQVIAMLASHPEYVGYVTIAISAITIAARLHSLGKAS